MMPRSSAFEEEYAITEDVIGTGMSGPVLLARRRSDSLSGPSSGSAAAARSEFVAVKRLTKRGVTKSGLSRLFKEAELYLQLDHPNIAKLIRVCDDPNYVYLVMENCSGGPLSKKLGEVGRFAEESAAKVVRQVLSAVNYCHRHPCGVVCHRDLKHANILYESQAEGAPLKLIDFGLSCVLSRQQRKVSGFAGTLHFAAPEVIFSRAYDESCDMWSLGVIAYSLLCGCPPFEASTEGRLLKKIASVSMQDMHGGAWQGVGDCAKEFVLNLLSKDPRQRPSAAEALRMPWIALSQAAGAGKLPKPEVLQSLRYFAYENAVRRAVAAFVVFAQGTPSSAADVAILEEEFRALDSDSDGTISAAELVQALQSTLLIPEAEARWVFRQLSVVGDARMHQSEFIAAVLGSRLLCDGQAVREAFSRFDENKDGKIELKELELVLGDRFCGEPTSDIFRRCDTNGDMTIDMDEFSAVVTTPHGGASSPLDFTGFGDFAAEAPQESLGIGDQDLLSEFPPAQAPEPNATMDGKEGGSLRCDRGSHSSPRSPPRSALLLHRSSLRHRPRRQKGRAGAGLCGHGASYEICLGEALQG